MENNPTSSTPTSTPGPIQPLPQQVQAPQPTATVSGFSIREAIKVGWKLMLKHIGFYILAGLIALGVGFLITIVVITGSFINLKLTKDILQYIFNIFYNLFQLNLILGYIKISVDVVDGREPSLFGLFKQYPRLINLIASTILYTIIVIAGIIFFIIPGIILAMRLSFYVYLIADKGLGPVEALKKSWEITKGQTIKLILLGLVSALIYIAGFLVFIVGAIFTIQIVFIAYAWVYRRLLNGDQPSSQPQISAQPQAVMS